MTRQMGRPAITQGAFNPQSVWLTGLLGTHRETDTQSDEDIISSIYF